MTDRCFQELLPSTSYIKGRIWSTSASMYVLSCNTSSHFPCWQRTLESDIWCANWESTLAQVTWYNQWVADRCFQSFSNLPYTLEEWYGTLQQQWMSYPATHHPIFYAEGGSQFWHFCVQFESQPWQKLRSVTPTWLTDAFRSSSHLPDTSNEWFGIV